MKVLQHSNVETFITFRSSTPLVMSVVDWLFLGHELPRSRSWLSLLFLCGGTAGFVLVEKGFKVDTFVWVIAWYIAFTFEASYVKFVCNSIPMSNWERVYYTNALAAPIVLVLVFLLHEHHRLLDSQAFDLKALASLGVSCILGVGMSHSGYVLRDSVSATSFTIVGITCKLVTIVINFIIWENHASLRGTAYLTASVIAGAFYKQAPKRMEGTAHRSRATL